MSLFQAKEWWSTHAGANESFGAGALLVGNVDNSSPAADKIMVGSLEGILRIYQPDQSECKIEDLVHEEDLGAPILQLCLGRLIPGVSDKLAVAVLHPRKVSVYECIPQAISKGRAAYYTLENLYTHGLGLDGGTFTAYNMLCAPFGGIRNRDAICVQCMDGKLQLFEQDAHAFSRVLSNTLLPGPLVYSEELDALIAVNSSRQAICCKYQALAAAQDDSGKIAKIRRAIMEWEINLGEFAVDAVNCRHVLPQTDFQSSTIIVGEHTLFALKNQGGIVAQRRLDNTVSCVASYSLPDGTSNLLLATHDGMLHIFKSFDLVWAAKLRFVPVSIRVGNIGGNAGMVVCVAEDGDVAVMFLGTQASATVAVPKTRDIDFAEVDKEYRQLSHSIKSIQNQTRAAPTHTLVLRTQVPNVLDPRRHGALNDDPSSYPDDTVFVGPHKRVCAATIRLYVMYTGRESIKHVQITTEGHAVFVASPAEITYDTVHGASNTPLILPIIFYTRNFAVPSSRQVTLQASYFTESGEPRVSRVECLLPLSACLTVHQPSKTGAFKLTLTTSVPAFSMVELFADLIKAAHDLDINTSEFAGTHAIGFRFWPQLQQADGGPVTATILVSKNGGRYRVQSNHLPALYFVINELQSRITERVRDDSENKEELVISFEDPLPLGDLNSIVDEHHAMRQRLIDQQSQLNDNAHQFRVIEKRLLVRMKDRTYLPMEGLEILMHETYTSILQTSDNISQLQFQMQQKSFELHSAIRLIVIMMRFMFGLEEAESRMLEAYFCVTPTACIGEGNGGHGWEELCYLSTMYLLKTTLAKNQRQHATLPPNVEQLDDVEKLKRHLAIVCDRICKGARLIVQPAQNNSDSPSK